MLNGVYNAEGEPLGLETIYPPDPADAYDEYENCFDDGPDGPFPGCCDRGDATGHQYGALLVFICDYCGEGITRWEYSDDWSGMELPYADVPRC